MPYNWKQSWWSQPHPPARPLQNFSRRAPATTQSSEQQLRFWRKRLLQMILDNETLRKRGLPLD